MNRKQRRTAAKRGHTGDDLCPGCNAKAVILHCCGEHSEQIGKCVMGMSETDGRGFFDFGILEVSLEPQTAVITVTSYGREVFRMNPDRVVIDRPGAWRRTLAAIAADLDAQFGRVERMSHDAPLKPPRIPQCRGPDFEDVARENIAKCGQQIIAVLGEPPDQPCFSYTIGNCEKQLPELLVIYPGSLHNYEFIGTVLNRAGDIQRERGKPFEHGELVVLQEDKPPILIVDATKRAQADYTFKVEAYYGTDDYEVRQLLYPDKAGHYPGDPLCAEPYASLPVLSPPAN